MDTLSVIQDVSDPYSSSPDNGKRQGIYIKHSSYTPISSLNIGGLDYLFLRVK